MAVFSKEQLTEAALTKRSLLCVGLDPDPALLPAAVDPTPLGIRRFLFEIIDATRDLAIAYKPNLAFFEAMGAPGWVLLQETIAHIGSQHLVVADAKRGDIGNTARFYAEAIFNDLNASAVTLSPYMGLDAIAPWCAYPDTFSFVLALTSNPGGLDFQLHGPAGQPLYAEVIRKCKAQAGESELGFVMGATRPAQMAEIRALAGDSWLLVPGIGAQGGDLQAVLQNSCLPDGTGVLINASRSILYASKGADYATAARTAARQLVAEMQRG